MTKKLGLIGLGNMGQPIGINLLRAGYSLRVYNRSGEKAAPLVAKGAIQAAHSYEVAEPGGIVLTMLANDEALVDVCHEKPSFVEKLGNGGIHVSLSTISPATSRKLAEQHGKLGVEYVACPVFGRPAAAAAARLWTCVSGLSDAKKRIQTILTAISQNSFDFGEDPGGANVVKLCGNFLIASAIEALAEALALAQKNGVDPRKLSEMLGQTMFSCSVYQIYGKQIAEQQFEPAGFRLALGLKDINLALQTAAASSMPMPLASLLRDRLLSQIARGRGDLDWTATALGVAEDAGIKAANSA